MYITHSTTMNSRLANFASIRYSKIILRTEALMHYHQYLQRPYNNNQKVDLHWKETNFDCKGQASINKRAIRHSLLQQDNNYYCINQFSHINSLQTTTYQLTKPLTDYLNVLQILHVKTQKKNQAISLVSSKYNELRITLLGSHLHALTTTLHYTIYYIPFDKNT